MVVSKSMSVTHHCDRKQLLQILLPWASGPYPNSFLQEWTDYKPGLLLKPSLTAWSVLPKSRLSFQTPRKSKPNCFYLKVSLRRRKELSLHCELLMKPENL